MIWWCKVRAIHVVVASTVGTVALGLLIGNAELPVPALTGQSGQFLVAHLMTLVPAVTLLYGLSRGNIPSESIAARNLRYWDSALALCIAAVGVLASFLCRIALSSDLPVVLGRNLVGYLGLALLLFPLVGSQLAGAALAAVPLILAASGWGPGGTPEPWAWLLHPADSTMAMVLAISAVGIGVAMTALWSRPPFQVNP
ncbi:hypothetical protein I3F58_10025 [Streptomyces sp. MUM 203J]|uniref:hypothetical protein n=1 Tax=Streptomyces sp. MUM 203J TaxID=2791990 RepID=UPI001F033F63|nr:hypothetical protein [Streptomyces sp. MUM 203J]MCH0539892.1 hypothetical protein [Streptomyces sp. MUM 203J]